MTDHPSPVTAIILAAGAGTRLGELGQRFSKATLPIAGRPLIDWIIGGLQAAPVGRIVVVGHPSDARLTAYLRDCRPEIRRVLQPQRRGIADAVLRALPLVADEPAYLACACDSVFLAGDIARVIARGQQRAGVAVVAVLGMGAAATTSRSVVRIAGDGANDRHLAGERVLEIIEKPAPGSVRSGLVALPLYWLPRATRVHLETAPVRGGETHVSSALNAFIAAGGRVEAQSVSDRLEITTANDIDRAAVWLQQHGVSREE